MATDTNKSYHYMRVKNTIERVYPSTNNRDSIISFSNTKYSARLEKNKAYQQTKSLNVINCITYILTKSKTKLIPNHSTVSFI